MQHLIKEVKTIDELLDRNNNLLNATLQNIDLTAINIDWKNVKIANTAFLGCKMTREIEEIIREKGAYVFPKIVGLPYNPYRKNLYTPQELVQGYDFDNDKSIDMRIYRHFEGSRFNPDIVEALAQRIHDHAIDDALKELLEMDSNGMTKKRSVGIMGGHKNLRTEVFYEKVAYMAKKLTEIGYFVMSGGGPGIMEASNLGAYFAFKQDKDLADALKILQKAPDFKDREHTYLAMEVLKKYPEGTSNLAIPTWFYGHEPTNLFATHTAKYFSNAIREDILLSASTNGIVFAPGSAGTVQEIFTDAAQNHYASFGFVSPMIFLSKEHWSLRAPVYELLEKLAEGRQYSEMLHISDEPDEIIEFIQKHPPILSTNGNLPSPEEGKKK